MKSFSGGAEFALSLLLASVSSPAAWGQWTCGGGTCTTPGSVGIGNTSPSQLLAIGSSGQFTVDANGALSGGSGSYTFRRDGVANLGQTTINAQWLGNDTTGPGLAFLAGSDPTLGSLSVVLGGHPSASGSSRYGFVSVGDAAAMRPLVLNTNGYGAFGNVGIGTTAPQYSLQLQQPQDFWLWGGVFALPVNSGSTTSWNAIGGNGGKGFDLSGTALDMPYGTSEIQLGADSTISLLSGNGMAPGSTRLYIDSTGRVGIGTTNPQHPLQVSGTIGAEEVIVSSTGADYVFQKDYKLTPLNEVASYIDANHHLPDVPSAKEVEENGVNLGDMQTKLLAKIEELTLHMIQMSEEVKELRRSNESLSRRIRSLQR